MKDKEGENENGFKEIPLNTSPIVEKKDSTPRKEEPTQKKEELTQQKEEPVKIGDNVGKHFNEPENTANTTSDHKDTEVTLQEIKVTGDHHEGCCCVIL